MLEYTDLTIKMVSLKEVENQVVTLINSEKWAEAYKICNQILSYDQENVTFIKLRNKIEKEVKASNKRSIQHELEKLEVHLKNKQYEEYLRNISALQTYVADFPEIGEKTLKAKKLLDQQYQERKDEAFNEVANEIKSQKDKLNFPETLQKLENLIKLEIHIPQVKKLQKKVKGLWIDLQLKENQALLSSQRYEDIIIFLLKLQKIDTENLKVSNLVHKVKGSYLLYKIENKKDFIFKTIEEVKTLYITKKYDLCMELCQRILDIDAKNKPALTYFKKSRINADRDSHNKLITQILNSYKEFPQSKSFTEGEYIRI